MKIQKNGLQYGGQDSTTIFAIVTLVYIVCYFTALQLLSKYIQDIQSLTIYATNNEALCKTSVYENETLRHTLFTFLNDKNTFATLEKSYTLYFGIVCILSILVIASNIYLSIQNPKSFANGQLSSLSISSVLVCIFLIILTGNYYIIKKRLQLLNTMPSVLEYKSKIELLKNFLFTSTNLHQLDAPIVDTKSANTQNSSLLLLEKNIIRRILHASRTPDIITHDDAIAYYKNLIDSDDGVNELIGYINFTKNSEDWNLLKQSICGTLFCLTEGIGESIINLPSESYKTFITLLQDPHSGYVPPPDISVIDSTDEQGSALHKYITTGYPNWLTSFKNSVAVYSVDLSNQLAALTYNDPIWNTLTLLTEDSQNNKDIPVCQCNGDYLHLGENKNAVLLTLDKLSSISFDNPQDDLQKYIGTANKLSDWKHIGFILFLLLITHKGLHLILEGLRIPYYLEISTILSLFIVILITLLKYTITSWNIFAYICSIYVFFHFIYTVYGRKKILLIYFTTLIFVSVIGNFFQYLAK
jgi:hypothetical protein